MYPKTYSSSRNYDTRRERPSFDRGFTCHYCGAYVTASMEISGVVNRNHCPYCLWSRHVDFLKPGDRMSACRAGMQPIGLTVKYGRNKYACCSIGELMLIHRCSDCSKLSINRIAADDQPEIITAIYHASFFLDVTAIGELNSAKIHLLEAVDERMVIRQLYGQPICC